MNIKTYAVSQDVTQELIHAESYRYREILHRVEYEQAIDDPGFMDSIKSRAKYKCAEGITDLIKTEVVRDNSNGEYCIDAKFHMPYSNEKKVRQEIKRTEQYRIGAIKWRDKYKALADIGWISLLVLKLFDPIKAEQFKVASEPE